MSYNQKKFLDYDGLIHLLKKFDDYPTNDILGTVIDSIGTAIDAKVSDVQIDGTSILNNGVANIPLASSDTSTIPGLIKIESGKGHQTSNGTLIHKPSGLNTIKGGSDKYDPIVAYNQHQSVFYGLAKAAGDTTQSKSSNAVGTYTNEAKAAIQTMLDVPSNATVTSAIGTAIGNVHQFSIEVVQALPTENIQEHTVYFVPKTGETNDVYDEYVYVNNGWEMIGNTQIDLSNYIQKTDYPSSTQSGVVKISDSYGIYKTGDNTLRIWGATDALVKEGTNAYRPLIPSKQHQSVFYGLAKAAGDTTQALSNNAVGTYTDEAKSAIRNMLGAVGTTDYATESTGGVIKVGGALKIVSDSGIAPGVLYVKSTSVDGCKAGINGNFPVTPEVEHASTFYGLAKAAGANMASSSNPVGTYTDAAKIAIRNMIGATSNKVIAIQDEQPTDTDTKVWLPETQGAGVEVPTYAEFTAGLAEKVGFTDYATSSTGGIVKVNSNYGLTIDSGTIKVLGAGSSAMKAGTTDASVITPWGQHQAAFYGLAKAAGADLANETVTVGTYPTTAQTAIRTMLGAVGKIDYATTENYGLVKVGARLEINSSTGKLVVSHATIDQIKSRSNERVLTPMNQHYAAFYGLGRIAGISSNYSVGNVDTTTEIGTYTAEAKSAIQSMLGVESGVSFVENISGTTVSIIGEANTRYMCGELSTLSITPPSVGTIDIVFISGSTPTSLTVPNTVQFPSWFDYTSLDANATYEINIMDGIYGAVMTW